MSDQSKVVSSKMETPTAPFDARAARAKQLCAEKNAASVAHSRNAIAWLEADSPTWDCGTPVEPSSRIDLLRRHYNNLDLYRCTGYISHYCECDPPCTEPVINEAKG